MEFSEEYREALLNLVVSLVVGAAIGLDRELKDKPAGLRTHMLVTLASCALMTLAVQYRLALGDDPRAVEMDPMRVIQGIISGVGFLGAGTIIQSRGTIEGITTAATIWLCSALGIMCGMGFHGLAVTSALLSVLVLWAMLPIERFLRR